MGYINEQNMTAGAAACSCSYVVVNPLIGVKSHQQWSFDGWFL